MPDLYGSDKTNRSVTPSDEPMVIAGLSAGPSLDDSKLIHPSPESPDFLSSPYSIFTDVIRSNPPSRDVARSFSPLSGSNSASFSAHSSITNSTFSDVSEPHSHSGSGPSTRSSEVPFDLHLFPDSVIEQVVANYGSMALIKQLCRDLVQKTSQINEMQRMYNEKERVLRELLTIRGVSRSIIDSKLDAMRNAETPKNPDVDEMMSLSVRDMLKPLSEQHANNELGLNREITVMTDSLIPKISSSTGRKANQPKNALGSTLTSLTADGTSSFFGQRSVPKSIPKILKRDDIEKTLLKKASKSNFKLPFFWKTEDDENENGNPPRSHPSNDLKSERTGEPRRSPFAIPLFPEDRKLPPVIATETLSTTRDNVNNFFNQGSYTLANKYLARRKPHMVTSELEQAVDAPIISHRSTLVSTRSFPTLNSRAFDNCSETSNSTIAPSIRDGQEKLQASKSHHASRPRNKSKASRGVADDNSNSEDESFFNANETMAATTPDTSELESSPEQREKEILEALRSGPEIFENFDSDFDRGRGRLFVEHRLLNGSRSRSSDSARSRSGAGFYSTEWMAQSLKRKRAYSAIICATAC